MKKIYIVITLAFIVSAASAQTKKPLKVYYVPFTELQFLTLQKTVNHADSLLTISDGKAKDIMPALTVLGDLFTAFNQAYARQDTLRTEPLKKPLNK